MLVLDVAQAGALVISILALVILCTHISLNMIFPLPRFVGVDDIPQHQHIVCRLALPWVGFGPHARTDATYERFELGGLEWRLADLQLYLLTQRPSRVNSGLIIIYRVRVSTPSTQNPDERARSGNSWPRRGGVMNNSTTTKLSAVLGLLEQVHRATFWQGRPEPHHDHSNT